MRLTHLTPDEQRLDALVNRLDIDQLTASRMIWAPELLAGPGAAPDPWAPLPVQLAWARERARQIVWTGLAPVLKWLGLQSDPMELYRRAKGGETS